MEISKFRDIISVFFPSHSWNIEIEGEVLKIKNVDSEKELSLSQVELDEVNEKLQKSYIENSYELLRNNMLYEIIVIPDSARRMFDEDIVVEDSINHINYKYSIASKEMVLSMILGDETSTQVKKHRMRFSTYWMKNRFEEFENRNILDFLSETCLKYFSLTISTMNPTTLDKFRAYALSYTYSYMYNRQSSMSLYDKTQISGDLPRYIVGNKEFDSPKKTYNPELVSYYNEAISSTVLPHKYLSFYHILEFFYEKIFSEDQIKKAREIITDVSFSYKRDKDIARLIRGIQQKTIEKDITINEKNALALLIQNHIRQDDLKTRLIERKGDEYLDVLNKKVSFSDGNPIIFSSDESQFIKSLTDRIYKTRNSIVHSKDSFVDDKKNNKYKRIRDDQELFQEITLIQVMAEIMINEESKPI